MYIASYVLLVYTQNVGGSIPSAPNPSFKSKISHIRLISRKRLIIIGIFRQTVSPNPQYVENMLQDRTIPIKEPDKWNCLFHCYFHILRSCSLYLGL